MLNWTKPIMPQMLDVNNIPDINIPEINPLIWSAAP